MSLIMGQIEPEHTELFALEFEKIAEYDLVDTLSSTNIDQSAPNLVKMYVIIRSWMSLIMDLIRLELLKLSALELEDLPFLAPLAKGQRVIVMAFTVFVMRVSVHPCVHKLFLQKTSPQKLLTEFLRNFTGMFLRWSSFKFLQIIVYYEEFWLPWQSK